MKKIDYKGLQLDVFYEKLDNGLEVFVLPKKNVNNIYVTFSTKYGSNIIEFKPLNQKELVKVPIGIAHFLEHKMFEQEDGTDIFSFYSERGADCNANTNYTKTSYLFSSPNFLEENLNMLLDYVQKPYFTDDNVEKEKGIITQEIKMYQDMPGTVIYDKILENTFNVNPMQYPIIGTIESINSITKDDLYTCYNTFYHPANMFIVIVGNVEANEVIDIVKTNQDKKHFEDFTPIKIKKYDEPKQVKKTDETIKLNVTIPKCAIAYKIKINKNIKEIDELMLKVKEYIEQNLYDENRKSYVRNTEDRRIDISLLGAVYPFNVFSPKEKKVLNTVENINLTLRTYTGGYQRYENDGYRNGSPWPISNLWMTLYYLEIGEKKKAKETFDFVLKTVGKHSFLGEQVDNSTLKPNWVIGLGWSHAMFIIVLEKLSNIK